MNNNEIIEIVSATATDNKIKLSASTKCGSASIFIQLFLLEENKVTEAL